MKSSHGFYLLHALKDRNVTERVSREHQKSVSGSFYKSILIKPLYKVRPSVQPEVGTLQYTHGHNQYNLLLDIQFHHHCLFSDAFLKPSACLIKGWTFEILFGCVSVKNTKSKFSQIL